MTLAPLWLSLKTALVATALSFCGGIALAYGLFRFRGRAKGFIDGILTLPIVLPPTVVGFLLLLLLGRSGPIGQLLSQWEITIIFSWPATVVASTVVALPLMYKTALGAFEQIDPALLGCARTLGASERRIFWHVMLPLARPGIMAGTILAFARALGEFGATVMLAGSIPGRTATLPIAIFLAVESGEMQRALIWVGIMVAIALLSIASLNIVTGSQPPRRRKTAPVPHRNREGTQSLAPFKRAVRFFLLQWHHPLFALCDRISISRKTQAAVPSSLQSSPNHTGLIAQLQKNISGFQLSVSLTVQDQPLGILGASGSGKSMTLRCIAGLEQPDQGRIVLNDRVLFDAERDINIPAAQRRIGLMGQNYALFPHMTVAENIGFGLAAQPVATRQTEIGKFLALMHLESWAHCYPHELSGGQQQRVALARALAPQPEALLLDEPISALDSGLRSQLETLLIETITAYRCPTLWVTHDLDEVYRTCDRLLVMANGDAIASGPKQNICERPNSYKVAQIVNCQNLSRLQLIDGINWAVDWQCQLQHLPPSEGSHVGIYAHHLHLTPASDQSNTFPCWLARCCETPHHAVLYLKLHAPAAGRQDYHLQANVSVEQWSMLQKQTQPWFVSLTPHKLMLMRA